MIGYWVCDPQMATFWDGFLLNPQINRRTKTENHGCHDRPRPEKNHGWLVVSTYPSEKYEFVHGKDDIPLYDGK